MNNAMVYCLLSVERSFGGENPLQAIDCKDQLQRQLF